MFLKYLNLILFSTILLQASPKVFSSLGNELEAFQEDCKVFQETSIVPIKIKKKCKTFNSQATKAFKVGYELDPYIDSDNINEKTLNKYLGLLRNLDSSKKNILNLMYTESKKARKQNNIKDYSQLIVSDKIRLYSVDYEFMENNKDSFIKNKRYVSHIEHLKSLEESRKPIEVEVEVEVEVEETRTEEVKKKVGETKFFNYAGEQLVGKTIDYIDYMELPVPHINKGHLEVMITYHNRDSGEGVSWKGGSAKLGCKAYAKNGKLVGSIQNKEVHSSGQQIYIKFDTTSSTATLKCNLDFLGKTFHDTIAFGGAYDLYSPTFSTRQE